MDAALRQVLADQQRRAADAAAFDDLYDRLLTDEQRASWRAHLEARAALRKMTPEARADLLALAERERIGLAGARQPSPVAPTTPGDQAPEASPSTT